MPNNEQIADTAEIAASIRVDGSPESLVSGESGKSSGGGSVRVDRSESVTDTDMLALIMRALYHFLRTLRNSPM